MPRDCRIYLEDMCEAGEKVRRYVEGLPFEVFAADEKTIDAVVRNLKILGEAAKQVPDDFRSLHPQVDWYRISGSRDILIHQDFGMKTLYQRLESVFFPLHPGICKQMGPEASLDTKPQKRAPPISSASTLPRSRY